MMLNVGKEIADLKKMEVVELRRKYTRVFGESTTSRHREFLFRRIAWRLQANAEGGLSERARKLAQELAADSDVRLTAPKKEPVPTNGTTKVAAIQLSQDDRLPMPGAVIARQYKGQSIDVRVLPDGFEFEGEIYRTLSAIAKKVTGTHWNGYHFFGLGGRNGNDRQED